MAGADSLPKLGALPSIGKNTSDLPSIAMGGGRGNFYIDEQTRKNTQAQISALNEFDNIDLGGSMKMKDPNEGKSMQEMWKIQR